MEAWSSGDVYASYMGRWSVPVAEEFLAWLRVPPASRWVDVGCGTGALTRTILALADPASVLGVDPSPAFLEHAAAHVTDPRVAFEVAGAEALPVGEASVDAVVSGLALNFVPDRPAAMQELSRAVRPGGVVAAYVWDYPDRMELTRTFWDAAVELDPAALPLHEGVRFDFCRPDPLRELFLDAGLADVEARAVVVPTTFADFDDFWSPFLGGQGPAPSYLVSLGDDARTALRELLHARLPTGADGAIRLTARAWALRGTRPVTR